MTLDKDSLGGLNGGFSGLDDPPIAGLLRKAVYDAAMARHEAKMRYNNLGLTPGEYGQAWADYMNAEQELDRVCRRAKEGR